MPQAALEASPLTGRVDVHLGKFWKKVKGHRICTQNGFSWDHYKQTALNCKDAKLESSQRASGEKNTTLNSQTATLLSVGSWIFCRPFSCWKFTISLRCPNELGVPDCGQPYVPRVWPGREADKAQISRMAPNISVGREPKQEDQNPRPSLKGKNGLITEKETELGTQAGSQQGTG